MAQVGAVRNFPLLKCHQPQRDVHSEMHSENMPVLHQELHVQNPNIELKEALTGQGCVMGTLKSLLGKPIPMQDTV